tara:strand:+ start:239 stop:685 length:447 start_codon:yes stop_codon:yes gene_type:complete
MDITKIIQWDMGHRIENHRSICKGLHGHRYKAEICISGDLITEAGVSEEGMVMDFADLKKIALSEILDKMDHGFMVHDKDIEMINFFKKHDGHKPVIVPFVPTAENVSKYIYEILSKKILDIKDQNLKLKYVKLWETPTSYAKFNGTL